MNRQRHDRKGSLYSGSPFCSPGSAEGKSAECARAAATVQIILDRHQSTMTPVSAEVVTHRDDEYDTSRGS
jgi:hypothetical protein